MFNFIKKFKDKIALNLGFFFLKNIVSRLKKYKY